VEGRIAVYDSFYPYLFADALVERGAVGLAAVSEIGEGRIGHFTAQMYPTPPPPDFAGRPLPIPGVTLELGAARTLLALMSGGPPRALRRPERPRLRRRLRARARLGARGGARGLALPGLGLQPVHRRGRPGVLLLALSAASPLLPHRGRRARAARPGGDRGDRV